MPNWNRIIVGDAFKLSSHEINYYRDMFLLWPFLLCFVVGLTEFLGPAISRDRFYGFKVTVCALLIISLAKERRILILVASCYVTSRVGVRLVFSLLFLHKDVGLYLAYFVISGGISFLAVRSLKGWRPSYRFPDEKQMHLLDLAVVLAGLGCALLLFYWVGRH